MNGDILFLIGRKLKEIRLQKKIKLIDLAARAKISKGLLSQVENNRTIPSLPILLKIIKVLDVDYSRFFRDIENQPLNKIHYRKRENYTRIDKEDAIGFDYFFILSNNIGNVNIQINLLEIKPNAQKERVKTDGYTYAYLLQGEVEYIIGEETCLLKEGDSVFFIGTEPNVPRNNSISDARLLMLYLLPVRENML